MDKLEIEIEIDNRKLTAKPNQSIIEVADAAGIYIPRFCYHKHLSVAANCRMCLVEVEKSPKTLPACATPVMSGMKVYTQSPKTIEAQRAVMEFLLINHPLDCPICDQGGECELQDVSMGYGASWTHYDECKRSVADENLGPLIETEMTRCIHCTRCVRFGDEVAGLRQLGLTNRGEDVEISTYVEEAMKSEVSGNIIDLCPVGALTSKPFRFTARAWELNQSPGIAPHDCLGSNLNIHTRYGKVMRAVSRENNAINETWISDRDRFSYAGLYHADRIGEPLIRVEGKWEVVDWRKAFEVAAEGLHDVINEFGADKVGGLASPNSTLEEFYLLQKIIRGLGSPHVDHRLREIDTRDQENMPVFPGLDIAIAELEKCDAILLIGSNIQKEQPLAATRIRKAIKGNAIALAVNAIDHTFNFNLTAKKITADIPKALEEIITAFEKNTDDVIASHLKNKKKIMILVGALTQHHPEAARIRSLALQLAQLSNAQFGIMTDGANTAGAWLAGAVPHRHAGSEPVNHVGLSAYEMLEKSRKAYLLLNVEPDLDCANSSKAIEAMKQAKFVVALSLYRNPVLEKHANVILPIAAFTETAGTFVNATGDWQSFQGVAQGFESARPAWKVLRVLGNFLHLNGFEYESSEEVKHEMKNICDKNGNSKVSWNKVQIKNFSSNSHLKNKLMRIGEIPIYSVDSLVRRSIPLQAAQELMLGDVSLLRIHPETAEKNHIQADDMVRVKQASHEVSLRTLFDKSIPEDVVCIAGGIEASVGLGDLIGEIEVMKV